VNNDRGISHGTEDRFRNLGARGEVLYEKPKKTGEWCPEMSWVYDASDSQIGEVS